MKNISPIGFAVALLCFFMPFTTVSCQGHQLWTVSGLQLANGTQVSEPGSDPPKMRDIPSDPYVLAVLICSLVGLVVSFLPGSASRFGTLGIALIGIALLVIFKVRTDADILKEGKGLLQVQYELGYFGAIAGLFAGGGLRVAVQEKKQAVSNVIVQARGD